MSNHTVPAAAEGLPASTPTPATPNAKTGATHILARIAEANAKQLGPSALTSEDVAEQIRRQLGDNPRTPAVSEAPRLVTVSIDPAAFASFSLEQLGSLHNVAITLRDVAAALCCQPRFMQSQTPFYTPAGEAVGDLHALFGLIQEAAMREADARQPQSVAEAEARAWLILRDAADSKDDFVSAAQIGAQLAASIGSEEDGE